MRFHASACGVSARGEPTVGRGEHCGRDGRRRCQVVDFRGSYGPVSATVHVASDPGGAFDIPVRAGGQAPAAITLVATDSADFGVVRVNSRVTLSFAVFNNGGRFGCTGRGGSCDDRLRNSHEQVVHRFQNHVVPFFSKLEASCVAPPEIGAQRNYRRRNMIVAFEPRCRRTAPRSRRARRCTPDCNGPTHPLYFRERFQISLWCRGVDR
jgi:hypothetical protein